MRIGVVVQARTGSSRLPGKVLLPFGDAAVLDHVLDRCAGARRPDVIAVATSGQAADDPIAELCARRGAPVVRGSEHDVLDRYRQAVEELSLDVVLRVTADSPFVWRGDIDAVSDTACAHLAADYVSNRGCAAGFNVEGVHASRLLAAARDATDPYDREHVMPYLYRHPDRTVVDVQPADGAGNGTMRITLDTVADYGLLCAMRLAAGADAHPRALVAAARAGSLARWHDQVLERAVRTAGAPAPPSVAGCDVCAALDGPVAGVQRLDGGWALHPVAGRDGRGPALALTTVAHRRGLSECSDQETTWLGRHLRSIDAAATGKLSSQPLQVLLGAPTGHVTVQVTVPAADDLSTRPEASAASDGPASTFAAQVAARLR